MSFLPELVAGLVIFALGALVARVQRKRRVIQWSSNQWTLISGDAVHHRVKVTFEGVPVEKVFMTGIDITNVGNDAVLPIHFHEPIRLTIDGSVRLLEVTVSGEAEGDGKFESHPSELRFAPRLFNPGDTLGITLLTDGEIDHELYVRAENTRLEWRKSYKETRSRFVWLRTVTIAAAAVVASAAIGTQVVSGEVGEDTVIVLVLMVALGFIHYLLNELHKHDDDRGR